MSRNTIELVAKFRDDASVGLRRLATEANRTMQIQSRAASSSGRQQQLMHAAAARLVFAQSVKSAVKSNVLKRPTTQWPKAAVLRTMNWREPLNRRAAVFVS